MAVVCLAAGCLTCGERASLPDGFVHVTERVPDAILEIRYHSTYNFVAKRIDGYAAPEAILTEEAAAALRRASDALKERGYRLKIYDAYRPLCSPWSKRKCGFGIIWGMEIEQVYREVAPKLQSYLTGNGCSYATACDIVQETFLRLWKRKDELSDDLHQVSGLAFTIARNYRNDLARKAQHEVFIERDEGRGTREEDEAPRDEGCGMRDEARPGEAEEEGVALRRRLKASLGRMPVELLETFALSRLGKLTVKDIASGTGASEANVKVRVHRAKEMLGKVMKCGVEELRGCEVEKLRGKWNGWAVFRAVMMLAAVDGEITKEELSLYRELAKKLREGGASDFDAHWAESVKGMAYIGFLSEMLEPEALVREFVREAGSGLGADGIAALERMASADGDYSRIERDCVSALADFGIISTNS